MVTGVRSATVAAVEMRGSSPVDMTETSGAFHTDALPSPVTPSSCSQRVRTDNRRRQIDATETTASLTLINTVVSGNAGSDVVCRGPVLIKVELCTFDKPLLTFVDSSDIPISASASPYLGNREEEVATEQVVVWEYECDEALAEDMEDFQGRKSLWRAYEPSVCQALEAAYRILPLDQDQHGHQHLHADTVWTSTERGIIGEEVEIGSLAVPSGPASALPSPTIALRHPALFQVSVAAGGQLYRVDVLTLTQVNTRSGYMRS
eukprot:gene6721-8595_t